MKEKLSGIFGSVGGILLFILSFFITYAPIYLANLPFGGCIVCFLVINFFPLLGTILTAGLYIYSSVLVFSSPFSWYTVVQIIFLVLYTLLYVVPQLIGILSAVRERDSQW